MSSHSTAYLIPFLTPLFTFLLAVQLPGKPAYAADEDKIIPVEEVFEPDQLLYPSSRYTKVAVLQWAPKGYAPLTQDRKVAESWKMKNRRQIEAYVREAAAKGAKLIVTPEFGVVGYPDIPELPEEEDNFQYPEQVAPYAETVPGPTTDYFSKVARELGIYLHVGFAEEDEGLFYNTVVALNPRGDIVAKFRKANLYQVEENYLEPGDDISVYDTEFGKVGIIICADVYNDFPMEDYRQARVKILALSTSWAQYNTGWDYFTEGAQWVRAYLLAANQSYFPDSGVIEPSGKKQSHIRQSTGLAYGYVPNKLPQRATRRADANAASRRNPKL